VVAGALSTPATYDQPAVADAAGALSIPATYEPAAPAAEGEASASASATPAQEGGGGGYGGGGSSEQSSEPLNGLNEKAINDIIKEHNLFRAKEHVPPLT
jgi:hypothetical protein